MRQCCRFFWLFFSLGSICYFIAEVIWIYYELILKIDPPFPGPPDIFWLLVFIFYFAGIIYKTYIERKSYQLVRLLFDVLIVMIIAVTVSWYYIINPILNLGSHQTFLFVFVYAGYPIGNLGLFFGVIIMLFGTKQLLQEKALLFLLSGFFFLILADSAYLYLVVNNAYSTGSIIDPLGSLGFLLIGLAGLNSEIIVENSNTISTSKTADQRFETIRLFFPYIGVLILAVIFLFHQNDSFIAFSIILISILVIIKQILVIMENNTLLYDLKTLNEKLENTVPQRTRQLIESEQRYKSLFDYHPDLVYSFDFDGRFTSINFACERFLNKRKTDIVGTSFWDFVKLEDVERVTSALQNVKNGENQNFDLSISSGNAKEAHLNITNIPIIVDNHVVGIHGIAKDITEHKKVEAQIHYMAFHDALTGLPNRRMYKKRLKETLKAVSRQQKIVAVLFIDLDGFKFINDTLGHDIGDQVLIAVTERLKGYVTEKDLIARQGGDEFTLILANVVDSSDVKKRVQEIIHSFEQPFTVDNNELNITCSIGIALYPKDGEDSLTLMKNADRAMYRVKSDGKNNYEFYTPEIGKNYLQ